MPKELQRAEAIGERADVVGGWESVQRKSGEAIKNQKLNTSDSGNFLFA